MDSKLIESKAPPPPPPIPVFFNHKALRLEQGFKHKRFHWKLSHQQLASSLYDTGGLKPISISKDLQALLFALFPANQTNKDSKLKKIKTLNLESGLYNNIRLIQIQCLTSWKKLSLKDVLRDVLNCKKCWEEQLTVFQSLKFDNKDEVHIIKHDTLDNIDCIKFLKILGTMEGYFGLRCCSTLYLLETVDQLNNFEIFLTALISMNDLVLSNVDILKTILEIILGITLYLNNMVDLPKNNTFCISNFCRLRYFKSSHKKANLKHKKNSQKHQADKTQDLSLLDVVGNALKDDLDILNFLNALLEETAVNVNEINIIYEQIIENMEKIIEFSKEVNHWNYVNNDQFKRYFCSKFTVIMATFNNLQRKYHQAMIQYYSFVSHFETGTKIKVEDHINDFNGTPFAYSIFDRQYEKVELFQILQTFLKEIMLIEKANIQTQEVKQNNNSFVIERKNDYEKMLNDMTSVSQCPSSENLRRLREMPCYKRPTKLIPSTTYGIDANVLSLLKRTREI